MTRAGMLLAAALLAAIGAAPLDRFDRVAEALRAGAAAEADGDRRRLADAAGTLDALGAVPVVGNEDFVMRWRNAGAAIPPVYRDRALGPSYRRFGLERMTTTRFEQIFLAGRRARVRLLTLGRAKARLSVRDDEDKPICAGPSQTACDWIPVWTTRFRIEIANTGGGAGDYIIVLQ